MTSIECNRQAAALPKIKVSNPVVELVGDEMMRIIWPRIISLLIEPHLDLPRVTFDLGIANRDSTDDAVTTEAAAAISRFGVGIKCATITPDAARVAKLGLKRAWKSCNGTIRAAIGGVIVREPILCSTVKPLVPGWVKPIVVARHGFGDLYRATEMRLPGKGRLTLLFEGEDESGAPVREERIVYQYANSGVALAIYNTDQSFADFARVCLNLGLSRRLPVYFTTKNTVLKVYDERFREVFQEVFDAEFAAEYRRHGLNYEHRLIDDMVASSLKSEGGFIWACKNYDGDVQSDFVAQGFGSLGMMASVMVADNGRICMTEAAHGTVTRHYERYLAGGPATTNPVASIVAWSRGLKHRAHLDDNTPLAEFAGRLEQACIETIEAGLMTKDLAQSSGHGQAWLTTWQFLEAVSERLKQQLQLVAASKPGHPRGGQVAAGVEQGWVAPSL